MYVVTYKQDGVAQAQPHLTEPTATAQVAALQATQGVTEVVTFGPVTPTEAENDTDYRLLLRGNYQLQERLKMVVLTRANYVFGWAQPGAVIPEGETQPNAISAAAAKYALLNVDRAQDWFPKIWENFLATAKPDRVTVAGIEAWVKTNWPIFALLWQDKLQLS